MTRNDTRVVRIGDRVIGGGNPVLIQSMCNTKTEDVQKRALQAIRKGKPLLFHWRGGYLTREVLSELLKLLEGTARQKGKHARTGLNWPQAVLHVTFIEEAPPEELVVEEANEGERQ